MLVLWIQAATDPLVDLIGNNGSITLIYVYIVVKEVLPRIFPQVFKALNKRTSTEDRLFKIIEDGNKNTIQLTIALTELKDVIDGMNKDK